eukprot:TRINITY_DN59703_c0_g1_i1.p1 TRINITY_DN59703_c0_g1~~TRINITY_DN59703_c0_g1_i1.p1  ORF type:complete len:476 (+),score=108.94 TRINITY_DN59703_c0_g1_i1:175-1602(+)
MGQSTSDVACCAASRNQQHAITPRGPLDDEGGRATPSGSPVPPPPSGGNVCGCGGRARGEDEVIRDPAASAQVRIGDSATSQPRRMERQHSDDSDDSEHHHRGSTSPGRPDRGCTGQEGRQCGPQWSGADLCLSEAATRRPVRRTASADTDGGTGGTGGMPMQDAAEGDDNRRECTANHRRECTAPGLGIGDNSGFEAFSSLMGVSESTAESRSATNRQALFGDKSMRPKLLRLRTLEGEVEALSKTRALLKERLPEQGSGGASSSVISLPPEFEAGLPSDASGDSVSSSGTSPGAALCLSDWVQRLIAHEEALRGVPARSVKEACNGVFGNTNHLIALKEVKARYRDILVVVDRQARERIDAAWIELAKLIDTVNEAEDFIYACFEKMDEEGKGAITQNQFVSFVCEDSENWSGNMEAVEAKDASALFEQMAKGSKEITYEQFKEEITHGCLQVLRGNMALRKSHRKRYRDYWF